MPSRRFLGLDISSRRYGWATFDGGEMKCGIVHCPIPRPIDPATGKSAGDGLSAEFTGAVLDWQTHKLRALYEATECDAVGIEEPLNSNAAPKKRNAKGVEVIATTSATLHMLAAVAANAARIAVSMSLPVLYVNQSSWRGEFGVRSLTRADRNTLTGKSSDWLKTESVRIAKMHGARNDGSPMTGDEGDACGIAHFMWAREQRARLDLFARVL